MLCNGIMTWNHASFNSYFLLFWHFLTRKPPGSHFLKNVQKTSETARTVACVSMRFELFRAELYIQINARSTSFSSAKKQPEETNPSPFSHRPEVRSTDPCISEPGSHPEEVCRSGNDFQTQLPKKVYQFFTILHEMQVEQKPTTVMTLQTLLLRKRRV